MPAVESGSDSSSSEDEGAKHSKKKVAKHARKGSGTYTTHVSSMITDQPEDATDEHGMLNDVIVLELSNDNNGEDRQKNGIKIPKNKNPTANIEEFWEPAPCCKGNTTAHRQCVCCK